MLITTAGYVYREQKGRKTCDSIECRVVVGNISTVLEEKSVKIGHLI